MNKHPNGFDLRKQPIARPGRILLAVGIAQPTIAGELTLKPILLKAPHVEPASKKDAL